MSVKRTKSNKTALEESDHWLSSVWRMSCVMITS